MIRVALKGIAGRKLRAALTTLAIVLGVAMVSGTFVFTDTIEKAIDTLFTERLHGLGRRRLRARTSSTSRGRTTARPCRPRSSRR